MIRLDHDADARRLEHAAERIGNLIGEPLLDLEPPRKDLDDAGNLGQPDDPPVGQIRDVRTAEERQHVVLAHRVDLDVAHADHAFVLFFEQRVADDLVHVHAIAAREPLERCLDAGRRLRQALAFGILAELLEYLVDELLKWNPHGRGLRVGFVEAVQTRRLHLVSRHGILDPSCGS